MTRAEIVRMLNGRLITVEALKDVIRSTDLSPFRSAKIIALSNINHSVNGLKAQLGFVKNCTEDELVSFMEEYNEERDIC